MTDTTREPGATQPRSGSIAISVPECAVCGHSTYHSPRFGCQECHEHEPGHAFTPVDMSRGAMHPPWVAVLAEANRVQWPVAYTSDLFRDWQCLTANPAARRFVWVLREHGTDLIWTPDEPTGEPVRQTGSLSPVVWIRAILRTYPTGRLVYHWDGTALVPISATLAIDLVSGAVRFQAPPTDAAPIH